MDVNTENETKLRTGFTTGSCATASSKAGILAIINQKNIKKVDIILPKRSKLDIQINSCEFTKDSAKCSVIKDGGDDPDVTHGAEIIVDIKLTDVIGEIEIDGGINKETAEICKKNGANVLVAGSYIFSNTKENYKTMIESLR